MPSIPESIIEANTDTVCPPWCRDHQTTVEAGTVYEDHRTERAYLVPGGTVTVSFVQMQGGETAFGDIEFTPDADQVLGFKVQGDLPTLLAAFTVLQGVAHGLPMQEVAS